MHSLDSTVKHSEITFVQFESCRGGCFAGSEERGFRSSSKALESFPSGGSRLIHVGRLKFARNPKVLLSLWHRCTPLVRCPSELPSCSEFRPIVSLQPTFLTCLTFVQRKHFFVFGVLVWLVFVWRPYPLAQAKAVE